jgi:hypothetical protein
MPTRLTKVAAGAGLDGLVDLGLVVEAGEDEDVDLRVRLLEPRGDLDAVEAGELEVEQEQIGPEPLRLLQRRLAVHAVPTTSTWSGCAESILTTFLSSLRLVLDDQDPHGAGSAPRHRHFPPVFFLAAASGPGRT